MPKKINDDTEQLPSEKPGGDPAPVAEVKTSEPVQVSIDSPGMKCDRATPGSAAERMLIHLAAQPKVRTRLPREPKEPDGAFATVILNGLRINILKGVNVEFPQQVSDIIDQSFYATEKAVNDATVTNPFTGKESNARLDKKDVSDQAVLS